MEDVQPSEHGNVVMPLRTEEHTSTTEQTDFDTKSDQPLTGAALDAVFDHQLKETMAPSHSLVDHLFGHIVSTELARHVLRKLVDDEFVKVLEGTLTDKERGERPRRSHLFRWGTLPIKPTNKDEFARFLNEITDYAFDLAKPHLHHRFAAHGDKRHAMVVSCTPDGENTRPDFLLLPRTAFLDDFGTLDRPHLCFAVAMEMSEDNAVLCCGDGSGMERHHLLFADGDDSVDFIRILLGFALADGQDLGQDPDIELESAARTCEVDKSPHHSASSNAPSLATSPRLTMTNGVGSVPNLSSEMGVPVVTSEAFSASSDVLSALAASKTPHASSNTSDVCPSPSHTVSIVPPQQTTAVLSTPSKRVHSALEDDDQEEIRREKRKAVESVVKKEASPRGRGTMVSCVDKSEQPKNWLAFKMSRKGSEPVADQEAAASKSVEGEPRYNPIVAFKKFKAERSDDAYATLGTISFLDEKIVNLRVENSLSVPTLELRRPVKYFWGVHDFVRGLRGALIGHEYLTKIGILHCNITENNVVLARYLGGERGYLIDFDMDMIILRKAGTPPGPPDSDGAADKQQDLTDSVRVGIIPYIPYNVLSGREQTYHDDLESFFYVLMFFFFYYAGPLSHAELREADEAGFVQPARTYRLSHMRRLPSRYSWLMVEKLSRVATQKREEFAYSNPDCVLGDSVRENWPKDLWQPIIRLTSSVFSLFSQKVLCDKEVSHAMFIEILDRWLDDNSHLELVYSQCPFEEGKSGVKPSE